METTRNWNKGKIFPTSPGCFFSFFSLWRYYFELHLFSKEERGTDSVRTVYSGSTGAPAYIACHWVDRTGSGPCHLHSTAVHKALHDSFWGTTSRQQVPSTFTQLSKIGAQVFWRVAGGIGIVQCGEEEACGDLIAPYSCLTGSCGEVGGSASSPR